MKKEIMHEGIVESIDGKHVRVRIVQKAACASCKISSYCNASESKEKIIDVWVSDASEYSVGDDVVVSMTSNAARDAVILCFVVPTVIVVAVIAIVLKCPLPEPQGQAVAALAGLASLVPYYLVLYFLHDMIGRKIRFFISKR